MKQDLAAAFDAYKVRDLPLPPVKAVGLSLQRSLEIKGDAEAQFMVGLFYATGLGGVEEDQGKVNHISSR